MKLKYILISFIILLAFGCSKSDDDPPCLQYYTVISEDCNCDSDDTDCRIIYRISKSEYNRLLEIQNESADPCILINSQGSESQNMGGLGFGEYIEFDGYLLLLAYTDCYEWF